MFLDTLNNEQRLVAENFEGPMLVMAGAGSGKTRAITYRIANMISHGIKPYNILAVTFTNKAAKEMKNRLASLVENVEDIWVNTFHSFCARILRMEIELLGYTKNFTIYADDDQISLLKAIIKDKNIDSDFCSYKIMHNLISDAKNKLLDADSWFAQSEKDNIAQTRYEVFYEYEQRMKQSNALDFNDLLVKVCELFERFPEVLEKYQNKFLYIHVDEYQDTNPAQYRIVKLLSEKHKNICVVGDDDQSIYAWRGADIRNILEFEKDFDNTTVIKLEKNYRSHKNILKAANSVIKNNTMRKDKNLWTDLEEGELITVFSAGDEKEEAAWICDRISKLQANNNNDDFSKAILYRTNAQSRVIEDMLIRSGINYKIYGGKRFYDRKEIRDVLSYLKIMVNPCDDIALKRIINLPKRAIGNATIDELQKHANKKNASLFSSLYDIPDTLSSRPSKCVASFAELISDLIEKKQELELSEFCKYLIDKTGLIKQYENDRSEESKSRIENINELLGAIDEYQTAMGDEANLDNYLENVSLYTDLDSLEQDGDIVSLMTLHSAKGLEFDAVFMTGLEENIFPSVRSKFDENKLEEERRLCYVGITRAKRKLFISYSKSRTLMNQSAQNKKSRFIDEIPEELFDSRLMDKRDKHFPELNDNDSKKPSRRNSQNRQNSISYNGDISKNIKIPAHIKNAAYTPSAALNNTPSSLQNIFKRGDRVLHKKFGEGTVVNLSGYGKDARIQIEFAAYGIKQFSLNIAPLVKINNK